MSSQPDPFTVVSLFSGCGGSSLGYKLAGGDVRLAVEWWDKAAKVYRLNHPATPLHEGDVADVTVEMALEMARVEPGELDVLDGSPPCQGFSTAGKRFIDDPRNNLFREYVRLLEGLRPKVLIMENVSGMVKGKMRLTFVECLRALKGAGYRVSCRLLNAMYFGVPQSRQRVIFVGVREDLDVEPSHPRAQTRPISVGEAPGPRYDWADGVACGSTRRLAEIIGVDVDHLARIARFTNLLGEFPGSAGAKGDRFPAREARLAARVMRIRGPTILCGRGVAAAFGLRDLPWFEWRGRLAAIPHPSGVCRSWNDPATRDVARTFLRAALGL